MKKKKHPKFNVLNSGSGKRGKKRVKDRWRKPKGIDNKKRVKERWAGASPNIGYKNSEEIRHLHPSGKREVLVWNVDDVKKQQGKGVIIRIAHAVGKRKREEIYKVASELGLRIANYRIKVKDASGE